MTSSSMLDQNWVSIGCNKLLTQPFTSLFRYDMLYSIKAGIFGSDLLDREKVP
jgi:hypothetical protein